VRIKVILVLKFEYGSSPPKLTLKFSPQCDSVEGWWDYKVFRVTRELLCEWINVFLMEIG
jgi:hypothetical protein